MHCFLQKNTRWTIDIEDCPIGTDTVRAGLKSERSRLARDYGKYVRGATILLRESTERRPKDVNGSENGHVDGRDRKPDEGGGEGTHSNDTDARIDQFCANDGSKEHAGEEGIDPAVSYEQLIAMEYEANSHGQVVGKHSNGCEVVKSNNAGPISAEHVNSPY